MTKLIIYTYLVKTCYKLLYIIEGVENSVDKVISWWPQLILEFLFHMPACLQCSSHAPGVFV